MRTSREWIDRTVAELDHPVVSASADASLAKASPSSAEQLKFEITLTPKEVEALDEICRADELSPKQALIHIVRARLLGQPQFGRSDRARLRACLELLRALEQHVGRAARPATALRPSATVIGARTKELLELGAYLHRIGRAIGEAMLGNLQYWRGEPGGEAAPPADAARHSLRDPAPPRS